MINISDSAKQHFIKLLSEQLPETRIRVFVVNPGTVKAECGLSYCSQDEVTAKDQIINYDDFDIVIDTDSIAYLKDAEVDYIFDDMGYQVTLKAPNAKVKSIDPSAPLEERITHFLQTTINPEVASHGGVVSLLKVEDKYAYLQFGGGCNGCSMASVTLQDGIENRLIEAFPHEIIGVKDGTEHKKGEHSYC